MANILLRGGATIEESLNKEGETILHEVTSKNDLQSLRFLFDYQYELDLSKYGSPKEDANEFLHGSQLVWMKNNNGQTIVHIACREGHTEALDLILEYYFKQFNRKCLQMEDNFGYQPIHEAIIYLYFFG